MFEVPIVGSSDTDIHLHIVQYWRIFFTNFRSDTIVISLQNEIKYNKWIEKFEQIILHCKMFLLCSLFGISFDPRSQWKFDIIDTSSRKGVIVYRVPEFLYRGESLRQIPFSHGTFLHHNGARERSIIQFTDLLSYWLSLRVIRVTDSSGKQFLNV